MPVVYRLSVELSREPELVSLAQATTLDAGRPLIGLKGSLGLYGSQEWWDNIRTGVMPQKRRSGIIQRRYRTGMDSGTIPNTFEMVCDDGEICEEGIYANSSHDEALFQPGKRVEILYVFDELKVPSRDGGPQYSDIVVEVSIRDTR